MYYREAGKDRFYCVFYLRFSNWYIAAGAFIVYDITDTQSFEKAKTWIAELKKNQPSCLIMLLGTLVSNYIFIFLSTSDI